MKVNEAIKEAMKRKEFSQNDMARALDMKTANQVSAKVTKENWTINSMLMFLNVLGYEVVIRPRKRASADEIVIDTKGDSK